MGRESENESRPRVGEWPKGESANGKRASRRTGKPSRRMGHQRVGERKGRVSERNGRVSEPLAIDIMGRGAEGIHPAIRILIAGCVVLRGLGRGAEGAHPAIRILIAGCVVLFGLGRGAEGTQLIICDLGK